MTIRLEDPKTKLILLNYWIIKMAFYGDKKLTFLPPPATCAFVYVWKPCKSPLGSRWLVALAPQAPWCSWFCWVSGHLSDEACEQYKRAPSFAFLDGHGSGRHVAAASRQSSKCWSGCQWSLPGMFERSSIKKSLLHSVEKWKFFQFSKFYVKSFLQVRVSKWQP